MAGTRAPSRVKFLGSYQNQLDSKGRVSLPAPFRREAADQAFVLIQAHPPALTLYPEGAWTEVEERLQELLRHQPEARMWVLRMMANAVEVVPDAQGRILIPARLKDAAGLDGQALLVGSIDKVEIWNPDRFASAAEDGDDYDRYAAKIFR